MATILVVDDEQMLCKALEKSLRADGYDVVTATSVAEMHIKLAGTKGPSAKRLDSEQGEREGEAPRALPVEGATRAPVIDGAIVDLMLPDGSGIDCIRAIKAKDVEIPVVMMTGQGSIDSAVEAMRAGAFHYVTKPFALEDLSLLLRNALASRMLKQENAALRAQITAALPSHGLLGASPQMDAVRSLIDKVALSDSNVLVCGESGTGKEVVARAIHAASPRAKAPFIAINCGAIPEELLEAELFGALRGAYTGAYTTREGKFAAAHGGTILLDEIGEMSLRLQVKLLRVLQERVITPVGGTEARPVDVRIIAATNRDLEAAVHARTFREDLYFRLHVIPITIAPLRERAQDVPILVAYALERFNRVHERGVERFAPAAMQALAAYAWPGNVRELENIVERIVVLKGTGVIELADLPLNLREAAVGAPVPTVQIPEAGISLKQLVQDFEHALIAQALELAQGNKNRAAMLLHVNRTTLVEKLKRQGGHHV